MMMKSFTPQVSPSVATPAIGTAPAGLDMEALNALLDQRFNSMQESFSSSLSDLPTQPAVDYGQIQGMIDNSIGGWKPPTQPAIDYGQIQGMIDDGITSIMPTQPAIDYGQIDGLMTSAIGKIDIPGVDYSQIQEMIDSSVGNIPTSSSPGVDYGQIQGMIDTAWPTPQELGLGNVQGQLDALTSQVNSIPAVDYGQISDLLGGVIDDRVNNYLTPTGGKPGLPISNPNPVIPPVTTPAPNPAPNPSTPPAGSGNSGIDWTRYGRDGGEAMMYAGASQTGPAVNTNPYPNLGNLQGLLNGIL